MRLGKNNFRDFQRTAVASLSVNSNMKYLNILQIFFGNATPHRWITVYNMPADNIETFNLNRITCSRIADIAIPLLVLYLKRYLKTFLTLLRIYAWQKLLMIIRECYLSVVLMLFLYINASIMQ